MSDHTTQIEQFIRVNLESYLQETVQLCTIPSISANHQKLDEGAAATANILARHGLQVEILPTPGAPVVVGRASGTSERTLLFYNHYDVQPPDPLDQWTTPPFEPAIRDNSHADDEDH